MKKITFLLFIASIIDVTAQTIPNYIPLNGLVGWYPFNGNANDESNSGNNGIPVGASLTTDRFGSSNSAYYFDGISSHVSIPTNFFNTGWNTFTISGWLYTVNQSNPNNNNTNQCVFNTRPHAGVALDFNWNNSNKYSFWAGSNPPSSGWNIFLNSTSVTSVTTSSWKNFIVVKNGTNYQLYIDGVLDKTFTNSVTAVSYYCKMVIGRTDSTAATETFFGKLDDFGMWNRALSATEITNVFQSNPTSISKTNSLQIAIFPNPASNFINVQLDSPIQFTQLKVSDVIGNEVRNIKLDGSNETLRIDVSDLKSGIYFVTVFRNQEYVTRKIIVNK